MPAVRRGHPRWRRRRAAWRRRPALRAIRWRGPSARDAAPPRRSRRSRGHRRCRAPRRARRRRARRVRRCPCARRRAPRRGRSPPPMPVETTMPSMKCAPRPAPCHRSPIAMHSPSPPRRTGSPVQAAAFATIGKRCQATMLMGLIVPVGRSIGPADPMPTPRTSPPATASASVSSRSATAQIACASPSGVGSCAWWRSTPPGSTSPAAIFVPPTSSARVGALISACGCCRAGGDRRDVRSRGPGAPGRRAGRRASCGTRGDGPSPAGAR